MTHELLSSRLRSWDELEGMGWDVRGAVQKIWQGGRDVQALAADKDRGSRMAIEAILNHTMGLETQRGPPTVH